MVERILIEILKQSFLDAILVRNMDRLATFNLLLDVLTQRVVGSTSIFTKIAAIVKGHFDRLVEEVCSKKALEPQQRKPCMVQISVLS